MTTVYVVNSSFIYLLLVIDELNSLGGNKNALLMIQEVDKNGSLKLVWDSSVNIDVKTASSVWSSYKLTFNMPVDMSSIYSPSIIPVKGLEKIPGEDITSENTTVHTVNSSLTFLKLIMKEMPGISDIENVTEKKSVWSNSQPNIQDHKWASFKLTFKSPFDMTLILKKYPSSIIKVQGAPKEEHALQLVKADVPEVAKEDVLQVRETPTRESRESIKEELRKELSRDIKRRTPKKPKTNKVELTSRKDEFAKAPNGFNASDPYSGIGQPYQNISGFKVNYINPGPPSKYKKANGVSANAAVKAARNEIDASRV